MEQPTHNAYWGPMVRERLEGQLEDRAAQVQALVDHPGWAVVEELLQAAVARETGQMVGSRVLSHGEYLALSRTVFALEVARQAPLAVLFEARRAEEQRKKADGAASGREEA